MSDLLEWLHNHGKNYTIKELQTLDSLEIFRHIITDIPDSLDKLENLQLLTLDSDNSLLLPGTVHKFPESICRLINLRQLHVIGAPLFQIPESINRLKYLEHVTFGYITSNTLPESFGELSQLKHLSIIKSNIDKLPESFSKLKRLKYLFFIDCRFTSIPMEICRLKKLANLTMTNKIKKIPQDICRLKKLQSLDIGSSPIDNYPFNILFRMKKLVYFTIRGNKYWDRGTIYHMYSNKQLSIQIMTFLQPVTELLS